jgi:hypothetical protein
MSRHGGVAGVAQIHAIPDAGTDLRALHVAQAPPG